MWIGKEMGRKKVASATTWLYSQAAVKSLLCRETTGRTTGTTTNLTQPKITRVRAESAA
jgi:hypothetical protein